VAAALYSFQGKIQIFKSEKKITPSAFLELESGTVISIGDESEVVLVYRDGMKYQIRKKALLEITLEGIKGLNLETQKLLMDGKQSINDTMVFSSTKFVIKKITPKIQKELDKIDRTTSDARMKILLKTMLYKNNGLYDLADEEYNKYLEMKKEGK